MTHIEREPHSCIWVAWVVRYEKTNVSIQHTHTHTQTHTQNLSYLDWVENTKRVRVCVSSSLTHTQTYTYIHTHTDTHTHTHTPIHIYCTPNLSPLGRAKEKRKSERDCLTHWHTRTYTQTYTHTPTQTHLHTPDLSRLGRAKDRRKGESFCSNISHMCIHTHTHTYTHTYTHTFACTRPASPWQNNKQNKEWTSFLSAHTLCVSISHSLSPSHTNICTRNTWVTLAVPKTEERVRRFASSSLRGWITKVMCTL